MNIQLFSQTGYISKTSNMPKSLSTSSLNLPRYNSLSFLFISCSMFSKTVFNWACHANPSDVQKLLDLTCIALSMYLGRYLIHLPTTKHIFLCRYYDSNVGFFSPLYLKLTAHVHSPHH